MLNNLPIKSLRPSSASGLQQRQPEIQNQLKDQSRLIQNPYKLPTKLKPPNNTQSNKQIEWERLYEESLQLKSIINNLKDENTKLKTKNVNLEKDLLKCSKIIEEMEQTGTMKRFYQKPSTDNQMILTLKNQVKQLTEELNDSHQELQNIKKSSKYTKITELEIECKNFQDETIRLQQFIEQLITENLYQKQYENDQNKMKDMLIQREQIIKQMKDDLEYYVTENKTLSEKFTQIVSAYQELDKMYKQYSNEAKNKLKIKDKQIQELKTEKERSSITKQSTIKKPKPQLFEKPSYSVTKRDQSFKISNNSSNHNTNLNTSLNRQHIDIIEQPIKFNDLIDIRLEIRLRLTSAQIKSSKLNQFLFNSSIIDCLTLQEKLTKQPFFLDKPDAQLFGRYLIEKPNQKYPYNSSQNLQQQTNLVRSEFFNLIGHWPVYEDVESKVIEMNIIILFDGLINNLEHQLNGQTYNYKDLLKILNEVLNHKDQYINKIIYEYIISKIIKECQNIKKLNGYLIIKYIKELKIQYENVNYEETVQELQKFYNDSRRRNYFFFKQLRLKQEQIVALFENKQSEDEEIQQEQQKSAELYLAKHGLMRSHSEPDKYDIQKIQEEEEDEMYQEEYQEQIKAFKEKFEKEEDYNDQYEDDDEENEQLDENLNNIGHCESDYPYPQKKSNSEDYQEQDFENDDDNSH